MSSLYVFMVASFLLSLVFMVAFIWNVKSGQWDDTERPSVHILNEDDQPSYIKKP